MLAALRQKAQKDNRPPLRRSPEISCTQEDLDLRLPFMTQSPKPSLHELLGSFRTTMLITRGSESRQLHARPMAIVELESSCRIWLITSQDSAKIHEIESCTAVHLSLQKEGEIYLSIDGQADIVDDRNRIRKLWDDSFALWFPKGADDPNIALIVVTPQRAEYWDHRASDHSSLDPKEAYIHGTKPEDR